MKQFILFFCITASFGLFAGEETSDRMAYGVFRSNTQFDTSLDSNAAVYKFYFIPLDTSVVHTVQYSVDGVRATSILDSTGILTINSTPGKHIFRFLYSLAYHEVFTDSLQIEAQNIDTYNVLMEEIYIKPETEVIYFKPVIYLYPQEKTEVKVKVDIHGRNPFFYPEYNDGWTCTAHPDGKIHIGDDSFNYLFWEADGQDQLTRNNLKEGFYVKGEDAVTFLENKLTAAGFNSKEKADFITFWGPRIQANTHNFVRFEMNESCNKFADLNITPKPNNIYRFYILLAPLTEGIITAEQKIEPMDREGFLAIEWGGQVSSMITVNPFNF